MCERVELEVNFGLLLLVLMGFLSFRFPLGSFEILLVQSSLRNQMQSNLNLGRCMMASMVLNSLKIRG